MISVKLYKENEFSLLKNEWEKLENGTDMTAFQTYRWYTVINEQYNRRANIIPGKAVYAAAYENGEIRMIAPLFIVRLPSAVEKFNLDNGAHILGKWGYTDYLNFIYSSFSEDCFEAIISEISKKYHIDTVSLHQLLPDTEMRRFLDRKYPDALLFEGDCAKIEPQQDFESYYKLLSKNVRQNLRTAQNRADKDGIDIHYEIMNKVSEKDASEFLEIYRERQAIKNQGGNEGSENIINKITGKYTGYRNKKFNFLGTAISTLDNGFILGCFSGKEKIGLCYGVEDERGIRIPVVCFKNDYSRYSPCMLCIYNFIRDSYENGTIKTFDLLKGSEQYKFNLGGVRFSIGYYRIRL